MSLLSAATVTTIGLASKAFLFSGYCESVTVKGLPVLLDALSNGERSKGQGIITVSNHLSILDDPLMWGVLPWKTYLNTNTTRWSLGAADIMFTNPLFSEFFRKGQVIETLRGDGIFQPAVDSAIEKLNTGAWIHLFGEGKVCQPSTYIEKSGVASLKRFKWGIGRILAEAKTLPPVIPIWLTGFDQLMPEGRSFPLKFLPRRDANLSIHIGDPIPAEEIKNMFANAGSDSRDKTRSDVTALIQHQVENLGRKISGNQLHRR